MYGLLVHHTWLMKFDEKCWKLPLVYNMYFDFLRQGRNVKLMTFLAIYRQHWHLHITTKTLQVCAAIMLLRIPLKLLLFNTNSRNILWIGAKLFLLYNSLENVISIIVAKTGGFFPNFEKHTGDYVEKLSTEVKEWIKKLKDNGKTLFLMTSSYVDFASCTMNYILGWVSRQYQEI